MKKALMVASVFCFFGFEKSDMNILKNKGYEVHCASNMLGECGDKGQLDNTEVIKHQIDFSRSPFTSATFKAYKQLKKLIRENNFDLIHCHTPVGGIISRLVAKKERKRGTKVIYTAHGFHFFKGAPIKNWVLYYPVEKLCSCFTDVLITINKQDYELAKKKMHAKKICYIPGVGVDTEKFSSIKVNREEKRKEINVPENAIMLLSVGELSKRKNHEVVIKALAELRDKDIHYCIAGTGSLKDYLKSLVKTLDLENQVHFLGYRKDIGELCKCADVFVLPSIHEGLSVALMEAMANSIPCIASDIRGNEDLIQVNKGGYLAIYNDVSNVSNLIKKLCENTDLRVSMGKYNAEFVKNFDINVVREKMEEIYEEMLNWK